MGNLNSIGFGLVIMGAILFALATAYPEVAGSNNPIMVVVSLVAIGVGVGIIVKSFFHHKQ